MAKVLFYTATENQFQALSVKDENALYFITDTGELYKGSVRYSFPVKQVTDFPATGESGVIYVSTTGEAKIWAGTSYIALGSNLADNFVSAAVRHEVTADEAGNGIYTGMTAGDIGILFTMNAGNQLFVRLTDLVDTYTADNASSQGVTVNVDGYKISAEVNLSKAENNQLTLGADGMYVAPLEWKTLE
jgi:hypothetical protein